MTDFEIRNHELSDLNFIFSTWLKGTYYGHEYFEQVPNMVFFTNYQKILEKIIAEPDIQIKVACLSDAHDVILGYVVYQGTTIHWIFVKESWRRLGIAKALAPKDIKTCTHLTKVGKFLKSKYQITFNPFLRSNYES